MRLSTSMIYGNAVNAMQNQTTGLLHTQQQIATGRRFVNPSDDPAAAAQSLQVTQAKQMTTQQSANQGSAKSTLSMLDSQLQGVTDLIQYVQQRVVQAGNGALNASDLKSMATDIKAQFQEMFGLANATDGLGQHLFSGNMGGTQPFVGDLTSGVSYQGDQGTRALQVSSSRQMPVSEPGDSLFMGNPYVTVAGAAGNSGSVTIGASGIDVAGALTGHAYQIQVSSAGTYSVIDNTLPTSSNVVSSGTFTSGAPIQFDGVNITLSGSAPAAGTDSFDITTGTPGIFDALRNFVNTLENPGTGDPAAHSTFAAQISAVAAGLTGALDSVLNVRATTGSRMNELDGLSTMTSDLDNQYSSILSDLQDTDYSQAVSLLSQQQIGLQAAQKSFLQVSGLSLFNYMS